MSKVTPGAERVEHHGKFERGFVALGLGTGAFDDTHPGGQGGGVARQRHRPDPHHEPAVSRIVEEADRSGVGAAGLPFEPGDQLEGGCLWHAAHCRRRVQ